ncbi:hypothetical protein P152DRAFT_474327 [Eremomyces bilateralis CBS 781.70]|uniref:Phosphodiesterase/alkaline phosphatase D n=1 Tax=Eremomyces bilateralis CBS 781.70 TaxID=1392243 RepID=A0A6G1G2F1_9PEZI|nr:uncharacterized protein P152DRAFT_474327 [Eremomyces bilateralis CBS 781.70]KAF1812101.1 hypothetical protein P152DRAFT_474327 [Eremomyces bilateralis CBS 781.70]
MLFTRLLGFAAVASAAWSGNLNYRSPSHHHPGLGIAIHKVVKRSDISSPFDPAKLNFTHGVASGDPYPESIILWTRVAPTMDNDKSNVTVTGFVPLYNHDTDEYVALSKSPVCVDWAVYVDKELRRAVTHGTAYTSSDIDYTVKVEADGLSPYTTYHYQFAVCGSSNSSPVGRFKTTPRKDDKVNSGSIAVFSCANHPFGFFNAYGNVARKDSVDWVVHLGDYVYEYKEGDYGWGWAIGRAHQPNKEAYSLYDYRRRHAQYKSDLDLQHNHRQFAWIPVWDDHEVGDNQYRDGSSLLNNTEDSFIKDGGVSVDQRKMNAVRAYFEWMPIRQVDMDDNLRIWRSFSIGSLFDLIMLDTRQYDRSITDLYWNTDYVHAISNDAGRSLMGSRQENWFYNQLIKSNKRGAIWRIIGSQLVFSRLNASLALGPENPFNYDGWDGYVSNRNRTFNVLYENNIGNNIMLAGDIHSTFVSDLNWYGNKPYNPETGEGSIGVEFGGSAVTSPSPLGPNLTFAQGQFASEWVVGNNPTLQFSDIYYRGYYELHITHQEVNAKYFGMPSILTRNPYEVPFANFTVKNGENKLSRPLSGGTVFNGALKNKQTTQTNMTHNTEDNSWFISN